MNFSSSVSGQHSSLPMPESAEPCRVAGDDDSNLSDDVEDDSDAFFIWCIIVAVADLDSDAFCFFAVAVAFLTREAERFAFFGTAPPVTDMRAAEVMDETEFLRCSCVKYGCPGL